MMAGLPSQLCHSLPVYSTACSLLPLSLSSSLGKTGIIYYQLHGLSWEWNERIQTNHLKGCMEDSKHSLLVSVLINSVGLCMSIAFGWVGSSLCCVLINKSRCHVFPEKALTPMETRLTRLHPGDPHHRDSLLYPNNIPQKLQWLRVWRFMSRHRSQRCSVFPRWITTDLLILAST